MGLHKLTAGDGYTYLLRQVAVADGTDLGRASLTDYYSSKGETPGRWVGSGLTALGRHSPRLMTQIRQAARVVPSNFLTVFPDHERHSLSEHEELLDAFAYKDPVHARTIAEHHVLEAGRSLAAWLDQRTPPTHPGG